MTDRFAFASWLSTDPLILTTANWHPREAPPLAETPLLHIWMAGREMTKADIVRYHDRLTALMPKWKHVIGSPDELVMLENDDRSMFFHDQLQVCPETWQIIPGCEKYYDAVLQSAAVAWKRHWLAAEVERVVMITYAHNRQDPELLSYLEHLKTVCPRAVFASPNGAMMDSDSLSGYMNQSRVGLILSPAEGGCRAVAEYQLCGLPVVTTMHRGGRMAFVSPSHMQIVPADEKAIAAAVNEFILAQLDPYDIREAFLKRHTAARLQAEKDLGVKLNWPKAPPPYLNMFTMEAPRAT